MATRTCLLVLICLLSLPNICEAQETSCTDVLSKARENFDRGHLYGIPATLKPCLDKGFDKSQKVQAYWLLTRTYLLIDDPISAEDSYLKLLGLDPEYAIDEERDPVDVVYLSKKFTTTPIFVLFAKVGANFSKPKVIHNFGTDNTSSSNEKYTSTAGFQLAGGAELNINNQFSLGLEFMFTRNTYSYQNSFFNNDQLTFEESLSILSAPLYLKYRMKFNKLMPFVYGGYSNELFMAASANIRLLDRVNSDDEDDVAEFPVTGPDVDVLDQRTFYNSSLIVGIGANYRVGYNYFFLDVRYSMGLTNIVDVSSQYNNNELLYKYGYVDDYKRLNSLAISVGYVHPLYKPRKKSAKNGILKSLFRKN